MGCKPQIAAGFNYAMCGAYYMNFLSSKLSSINLDLVCYLKESFKIPNMSKSSNNICQELNIQKLGNCQSRNQANFIQRNIRY